MIGSFPEFDEFRGLLDALCEETITAEQMQRLEELIVARPEAEAYYVQFMNMYADLARQFSDLPAAAPADLAAQANRAAVADGLSARNRHTRNRFRRPFLLWGSISVIAASIALLVIPSIPRPQPQNTPPAAGANAEALDDSIAVLSSAVGAEWEDTALPTKPGSTLSPGWLHLKAGLVQIEFYSGATVVLEGPADFLLISRMEAYCSRGKLRAKVPTHAQGFAIGTPKLDLIDRGTEFGLAVDDKAKTEVHVFQGKVDVYDPASKRDDKLKIPIENGKGVRTTEAGKFDSIASNSAGFKSANDLEALYEKQVRLREQAWRTASNEWLKDGDLLAYFTFQDEPTLSRSLTDRAGMHRERVVMATGLLGGAPLIAPATRFDGTIVASNWTTGRWPGRRGLEFNRVSDRVRFDVPGEFSSITLMAWVRVDSLPNRNNALMMSEGWDPGHVHWQIGNNGMMILGVQSNPKGKGAHYHAPGIITPERFGEWIHVAVVYDRENWLVTHYVDGKAAVEEAILFDIPLRIGKAELGNWNLGSHRNNTYIRFLHGGMDEFLLFSRALTPAEIEKHQVEGRPPS